MDGCSDSVMPRDEAFSYMSPVVFMPYETKFRDQWHCYLISKGKRTHVGGQQYRRVALRTGKQTERQAQLRARNRLMRRSSAYDMVPESLFVDTTKVLGRTYTNALQI